MDRVLQSYVAPSIRFFKEGFLSHNNLIDYYDLDQPAIFFGAKESTHLINKHRGYKIILPCTPTDYPNIVDFNKTMFICSENYILPKNVIRKNITPKIKNYDIFEPNTLGDRIYFYSGFKNGWNKNHNLINEIQKKISFEIITTNHQHLNNYYDIQHLKSTYYDKCFLNINLSMGHGLSTTIELGLMGRKTIFNNTNKNNIQRIEFPNFITYGDFDSIIDIINNESKKIGTLQSAIDAHNIGDEWLNLNFWL